MAAVGGSILSMNIIQILSISAIVGGGIVAVCLLVYTVWLFLRWSKEDREEAKKNKRKAPSN
ncbi:MAG: hypothetical protein OXU41_03130 [Gammaproteobacteria bacterium]|nr:hypothetical protein [Gammaproteobacteria bacterium]